LIGSIRRECTNHLLVFHDRSTFPINRWRLSACSSCGLLIEKKGSGLSLIQDLQRQNHLLRDLLQVFTLTIDHASREHRMNMSPLLMAAGLIMKCCDVVVAQAPLVADLEPVRKFQVEPALTDDDEDVATDISGIACMPPTGATRTCLVVNDQDRSAQFVTIEGHRVIGGRKLQLIGKQPSDTTIGQQPRGVECSDGNAKFKDLDGEGVAFAESHFYVSGSHGCSRSSNKFRLSSFILARVRVDAQGLVVDRDGTPVEASRSVEEHVETTYRLAKCCGPRHK
jgi:hypothetical protein